MEIQEITFGVSISAKERCQPIVAAFNKKYPAYHIKMKTYSYDDMSLRTELIAGKEPVLVDTMLVGFKDNADWWEPLDEVFRQMQMDGELIPQVIWIAERSTARYMAFSWTLP